MKKARVSKKRHEFPAFHCVFFAFPGVSWNFHAAGRVLLYTCRTPHAERSSRKWICRTLVSCVYFDFDCESCDVHNNLFCLLFTFFRLLQGHASTKNETLSRDNWRAVRSAQYCREVQDSKWKIKFAVRMFEEFLWPNFHAGGGVLQVVVHLWACSMQNRVTGNGPGILSRMI